MPPADGESKQGKEPHAEIATGAFKDAISCKDFSLTLLPIGRPCFLWFYNIVISQQDSDSLKINMEALPLSDLLDLSQIPRPVSGSGPEQSRSPLFITLVRPWTSVGLRCPGPGLHVPGCSQVSKIGRPPWNPTLFTSDPPSLPQFDSLCLPLPAPALPPDMLHSCCHSALSQSQFIPSCWPFRDMHSPGRRGRALFSTHAFIACITSSLRLTV